MARSHTSHRCRSCGASQPRWAGRCPSCDEWGSLEEEVGRSLAKVHPGALNRAYTAFAPSAEGARAQPLDEVDIDGRPAMRTGVEELDRALSGGLLPGSSTLVGGEPGAGKSTLLLQMLASMAMDGRKGLLVAAEEAAHQVRRRAARLRADLPGVFVLESGQLDAVQLAIAELSPDVVVVDSVHALTDPNLTTPAGSVPQVRECAMALTAVAKAQGAALVLVGHVTKDGNLAGPRTLEHLVDTVLSFEGDRYSALRALRAVKHRFGPTGETGLFEMTDQGLIGVPDPSALFLGDRLPGSSGSAVAVHMEGHRPVLVEVQALVGGRTLAPRRVVGGADPARVGFLVAVLSNRAGVPLTGCDVYVSVAGGARATEPASDLAICMALASAWSGLPVPPDLVAIGEVGLGGEVRRAPAIAKRLDEARRLGFARALLPGGAAIPSGALLPRGAAIPGGALLPSGALRPNGSRPASDGLRPNGSRPASDGLSQLDRPPAFDRSPPSDAPPLPAELGVTAPAVPQARSETLTAPTLREALALVFGGLLEVGGAAGRTGRPGGSLVKRRATPGPPFAGLG